MLVTNKKFNGNTLKLAAIIAMTIDHAAWLILPRETIAAFICHIIGRLTFPVMAFMIVEGYHHTRDVRKYLFRLAISALIAHFAYAFCFNHSLLFDLKNGLIDSTSVLWGFTFGLLSLIIYHHRQMKKWLKVVLIILCIILAIPSDWSWVCVVFILVLDLNYGNMKRQFIWMTVFGFSYALVYCLVISWWSSFQFAVILAFPLLFCYNGERGRWMGMKWLFYIYYPLHLIILGLIRVVFHIVYPR
jgi:hypothetical protein